MIDLAFLILSGGITFSLLFFSTFYCYKIFSEVKFKKSALEKNYEIQSHHIHHQEQDKLTQKLEKYQSESFGRSLVHPSERTRMIAARIREESKTRGEDRNAH